MTQATDEKPAGPRSQRGRRLHQEAVLQPIDQIRPVPGKSPGVDATGAWAYYIRPEGATIRDALILYPNGGIPDIPDERMRARYGINAEYYRARQGRKGYSYVGPTLTEEAVTRLVEVMASNREDEVLFCEDEIENCKGVMNSADRPEIRDQARKRIRQYERRLETLLAPFDADALLAELKDIARAQMLADIDPNVLKVMKALVGEANEKTQSLIARIQAGKPAGEKAPGRISRAGADASVFDATGKDTLEL